jgi:hypothetical protein
MYIYFDSNWVDSSPLGGYQDRIVSPNNQHSAIINNTGTTTFGGNVVPGASTYTLGTLANPWKDLYVSQGSVVIANTDPLVDGVSISNSNHFLVISQGGLKVTANDGTHEIFQLDGTGKLLLKSEIPLNTDSAAFEVIGSLLGESLPIVNRGVMIHASGAVNVPSRVYVDGVGTQLTSPFDSAYPAFIGRYARGTVASPQPAEAGDIIVRFGGNALANTLGLNTISNVRIDMTATETQSASGRGSRIELWTTPIGSVVPQRSLHVDSGGIDLSEATDINAGITFKNGSLLKYWPAVTGNTGKILRTNGTDFFWDTETVPAGQVLFKGDWSAANPPGGGTPTISDSTGVVGWQYIVSAAGTQDLGHGSVAYTVGDQLIHDGTRYVRIPAQVAQVQADWTETNSALPAYIKHKPTLATVATTGSYNDLVDKPYIPPAQVNSDWNSSTGASQILNKPTLFSGVYSDLTGKPTLFSGSYLDLTNKPILTNGTVTSVGGTGTVSGLTLSGTVTSTGNLTLGGTLALTSGNVTTALGFTPYNATNPAGYTTNVGTVTSVAALTLTTTGTDITSTVANGTTTPVITLNVPTASASNRGLLSSTDWTTFNNKVTSIGSSTLTVAGTTTVPTVNLTSGIVTAGTTGSSTLIPVVTVDTYGRVTGITTAANPQGTVTSIAASTTPVNGLSLSGGTITSSGTIAITGTLSGIVNSNLSGTAGITNANLANSTISGVSLGGSLFNLTAGTGITFSSGTTYNGSAAITINATADGVDTFSDTVTTQASTLTVDFAGVSTIFWQPSATGNRTVTLSNFTAGRRVKIFITPKANNNTFTFTGVTASQCSNGSITFVLGGGGVAQSSMMIELFSTTTAIGGVWIFGYGSQ